MSVSAKIEKIRSLVAKAMLSQKAPLSMDLARLEEDFKRQRLGPRPFLKKLGALENKAKESVLERTSRERNRPRCTFPEELPITAKLDRIVQTIRENQVVIISGDTGSGKSTQIPKMCLEAGRGVAGKIGCTQPRRIAAITISQRIAQELGEQVGHSVGYKIRFKDRTSRDAYIKIMTDGMLLAETQGDPRLAEYDTLIIDEAHERSINIDLLLGLLRTLLPRRPELKLVISSATLDLKAFSEAFDNPPIIEVSGRRFPVEVSYMPVDPVLEERGDLTYVDMAVKAVEKLREKGATGDILIFMPTERDIMETCEKLEGRQCAGTAVLPLFARLSAADQGRIYSHRGRKIVVATNVAETSLTIPGIKYVIDTGLARILRYAPSTRISSLPVSPISRSSADQRMGRCGRVSSGVCIRLYSKEEYESRPAFSEPEIGRSNLAEVILRMISLNLGDISSFPFIDRPSPRRVKDGFDLLSELGAIKREGGGVDLTETGRVMARMPMDPRISRMILEARKENCVREVAVIASALSIQDPRERPAEKALEADRIHEPFRHPDSDFLTLLNIWNTYHNTWKRLKTQSKMRKFCRENFLSFPRMREWAYVYEQIATILKEQRIGLGRRGKREMTQPLYEAIHRCIVSGFLSNIAMKKEKNLFLAARGREAMVYPGSTLFNRKGISWIVAAEIIKTSRLFARTAAKVESRWFEDLAGDLCRRSHTNPRWDKTRGEVVADEMVSLYGLPIARKRSVPLAPVDPRKAHEIFVQSALVEGRVRERLPFLVHNRKLVEKIREMEERLRRRNILVDETAVAHFYSTKLKGVCDMPGLIRAIRKRGGDLFLRLEEEGLFLTRPSGKELSGYPDHLAIGGDRLKVSYKFAPGTEADGATVSVPSQIRSRIPPERLEWGIPGLYREKIMALIKGLPKRYRKHLIPVSRTVETILEEMNQGDQPLFSTLSQFIYERFGLDIPAAVWCAIDVPDHLKIRISITDGKGKELESGRDMGLLGQGGTGEVSQDIRESNEWQEARKKWERSGIKTWDFGDLPDRIDLGKGFLAYPALEPDGKGVKLSLFADPERALSCHRKGVRALFSLSLAKDLRFLKRALALPDERLEGTLHFGGKAELERGMYEGIVREFLDKNIRTREAFLAHAESVRTSILSRAKEMRDLAGKIVDGYLETRRTLDNVKGAAGSNRALLELCERVSHDLEGLVPSNFPVHFPPERLMHIPRYLRAMKIRLERGSHDPEKDRRKAAQLEVFEQALARLVKELSSYASPMKRVAVEDFRWMVEEFKVSLFAQELKTLIPVSQKRLEDKLGEIDRMI